MTNAFIPYGIYWSTPFAKWQGSIAHLNSIRLAAVCGRRMLDERKVDTAAIDLGILGITNPQLGGFYGLPWLTGMMGLDRVAGPTIQQACASSARALQMAAQEIGGGTARSALVVTADRCSTGPIVHDPDPTAPGVNGHTEKWVMDNFGHDPYARNAMIDTAENVARRIGVGTAEMNQAVLQRHAQYQDALANERAFQKRYMQDVAIMDAGFRKQIGTLSADEGVFPTSAEGLARLKPVKPEGSVTFGTQTHPADGNAGTLVTSRELARAMATDKSIEIELLGFGQARVEKGHMPMAPAPAALAALKQAGLTMQEVDAVKTHNPFAVNDIAFARETGFAMEKMNNYGSSLIWGHPQGPTGMRSVIELIEELALRGGGTGVFSGCAAGDSAVALVLQVRAAR